MKKIVVTTTKTIHVQVLPDIQDGFLQAMEKRKVEIDNLIAKRNRRVARWKKQKKGGKNI